MEINYVLVHEPWPVLDWYLPVAQSVQLESPAAEYLPVPHVTSHWVNGLVDVFPAPQFVHVAAPAPEKVPAAQFVHMEFAVPVAYVPMNNSGL